MASDAKPAQPRRDSSGPHSTDVLTEVERVVMAGHRGDHPRVRSGLTHVAAPVRIAALGALARTESLLAADVHTALVDEDHNVRRRACELVPVADRTDSQAASDLALLPHLDDPDDLVAEMAAWATGERLGPEPGVFEALTHMLRTHDEALCREAAAAALGAVAANHPDLHTTLVDDALDALVSAMSDKAPVRRRAVLALAAFDDPRVETTLEAALRDRDWQVRQGAEDLIDPVSE